MWSLLSIAAVISSLFTAIVCVYGTASHYWLENSETGESVGLWEKCQHKEGISHVRCDPLEKSDLAAAVHAARLFMICASASSAVGALVIIYLAGNGEQGSTAAKRVGVAMLITGLIILIGSCWYTANRSTHGEGFDYGFDIKLAWCSIASATVAGCIVLYEYMSTTRLKKNYDELTLSI
ncbi:uncharacterized protein [Ptychodera flava]|uniref:uncharacterized protein n=1 Tax=Ptychodera flava TaxID=63121 RepID=UPI00396A67CD